MNNWRLTLKNAKKSCIQQGDLRKVHYELPNEQEMVEEYNMKLGVLTRRAWKLKKKIGGEGDWLIEVGDVEPQQGSGDNSFLIKESSNQPFVTRYNNKNTLEWRIRNLPYSIETYSVSADETNRNLIVRTTNKKFYKCLEIPELERLKLEVKSNNTKLAHKYNTLVISYTKPQELIDFEKSLFGEIKDLPVKNEGAPDCKPT